MNSIRIKKPTLRDLQASLLDCGLPDYDKRGVPNILANSIQDYVVSNFSDRVETDLGYEPILHWILNNDNDEEIRELITCLVGDIEILYFFEVDTMETDFEYLEIPLFYYESLDKMEVVKSGYLNIYYHKIIQATNQLIVMHRLDASMEYIFNYSGVCLNDEVRSLIYKNYENHYFGGNLTFQLGDNDKIIVTESGNEYYYPSQKYLLEFDGENLLMVRLVEDDFQFETHSSENVAIELTRMFMGSIA